MAHVQGAGARDPGGAWEPGDGWPALPAGTAAVRLAFADLPGWPADDHAALWPVFHAHCRAAVAALPALRAGAPMPAGLAVVCREAAALPALPAGEARAFFERHFTPVEIVPASGAGFLTGYYEPEVPGALARGEAISAPLMSRPDDLVTLAQGESVPGLPAGLMAARRTASGHAPYATRGEIAEGAPLPGSQPIAWLRDDVEVFLMQVQGSGRVRLADGTLLRIAYAGRNGHPYTSIGRVIVEEGHVPLAELTLARLKGWLRENPQHARRIMHRNASYIFFRRADELPPHMGPIGGAGLPLTPWRSIAVDRTLWPYGLPVWLDVDLPGDAGPQPFRQLTLAEDTGSAIVGPARADLFHGTGDEAGRRAGALRHPMRFVVLWPKPEPAP